MNVLSLFDGISCGHVALDRADIKVDKYFTSAIDTNAIKISNKNYPNTIQLGDISSIDNKVIKNIGKIDLLIGGSPCQDISFANLNSKGIYAEHSGLFFEYLRILKEIKPKYFLLENVVGKKESIDAITQWIGVKPIMINSSLVSGQGRERLYWTNIPGITQPQDKEIKFYDVIDKERKWFPILPWSLKIWGTKRKVDCLRTIESEKSFCITTNKSHPKNYYLNKERNMMTKLNADEVEKLQTLPLGYTDGAPEGQRFKMIGNGWTVDVIAWILSFIPMVDK